MEGKINPENSKIDQDSLGNIWIASGENILKYNSAKVFEYNATNSVSQDLGTNYTTLLIDDTGHIWIGTENGVGVYDPKLDGFKTISLKTGKVSHLLAEDNKLWIAAEEGVFEIDYELLEDAGKSIQIVTNKNIKVQDMISLGDRILVAGEDDLYEINTELTKLRVLDLRNPLLKYSSLCLLENSILIGTANSGLYKTDLQLVNLQKIYTLPWRISHFPIINIEYIQDKIYLSTEGAGMVVLDQNLELVEEPQAFQSLVVKDVFKGNQNLLWFASKDNLFKQPLEQENISILKNIPGVYSSLGDDKVSTAEVDSYGNIWIGTGKGLSVYYPETEGWRHINNLNFNRDLPEPDEITAIKANGEHVWVATKKDGVYKINALTILRAHYAPAGGYKTEINSATALFIDKDKNVWIGGKAGKLTRISPANKIETFDIKNVQAISGYDDEIIAATSEGTFKLNPAYNNIVEVKDLRASKLKYSSIDDIDILPNGAMAMATNDAGIILFNLSQNQLKTISKKEGLPSNTISGVYMPNENEIWATTDNGLAHINTENNKVRVFTNSHGLSSANFMGGILKLNENKFAFGSDQGLNILSPSLLLDQDNFEPAIVFEGLEVSDDKGRKDINLYKTSAIELSPKSSFSLNFQAITHNSQNLKYSWMLEGLDRDWSAPSSSNEVNYGSLPPGNYIFKVRAQQAGLDWTKPKTLNISVPGNATGITSIYLFLGLGILATIGVFIYVFRHKSKSDTILAKAELRSQLKKEFREPIDKSLANLNKIAAAAEPKVAVEIQRSSARIEELFQQILNFNYQESVYEITAIDLSTHIPELINDFEPLFQQKKLQITVNDQWGKGPFYYSRETLDKIFFGLISGSSSYCFESGKIIVNLIETNKGDLKIQVADNGSGIPKNQQKLLERKRILRKKFKINQKGGVMQIIKTRDLILKSNGSFIYESEKNEGTTFTVVLKNRKAEYKPVNTTPVQIPEQTHAEPIVEQVIETPFPQEITNFSESKILIIESDEETRDLLVKNVGKYCQIYQASSAEEGMEKAGMIFPDIIISATVLPDMNAFQLAKMLKRNIGLNHINIFLVADEDHKLNNDQIEELTEVIRKPIDINLLLSKIVNILSWQQELRNAYVQSLIEEKKARFRSESDEKFVANLNEIVIQNIENENFSVHDLSAAIGVTSNTLFMKLKSLVNLSPQDFIEFVRVNHAKDLAKNSEYNIMEVAYRSGFGSPKIFFSAFKKYYGFAPTDNFEKKTL
ncbi:helix-turn-helix domain-containing protein [Gramella sp. AN32]|uniref:Helix-turn-helix domain-containing protein n=1 Tax=Christiangramia antarctica TaxID=2058158 RepID=A0ABW5X328_9FLAO|nr:helix-turn-helix domain-containing protein [Gramella sp. AN32]MCM4156691.1 hypothetical protein [Gramella sp. AN32]